MTSSETLYINATSDIITPCVHVHMNMIIKYIKNDESKCWTIRILLWIQMILLMMYMSHFFHDKINNKWFNIICVQAKCSPIWLYIMFKGRVVRYNQVWCCTFFVMNCPSLPVNYCKMKRKNDHRKINFR